MAFSSAAAMHRGQLLCRSGLRPGTRIQGPPASPPPPNPSSATHFPRTAPTPTSMNLPFLQPSLPLPAPARPTSLRLQPRAQASANGATSASSGASLASSSSGPSLAPSSALSASTSASASATSSVGEVFTETALQAMDMIDDVLVGVQEKRPRGGNIELESTEIIMIQGFNWDSPKVQGGWYKVVKEKVADMAAAGITDVWLPPPSKSVDRNGYMPTQLYNLDASSFGNEQQLKELIDEFHAHGMRVHADIVINHRCGDFQDEHGNWTIFEGGTPDERLDWGPWAIVAGDQPYGGQGQPDTGDDYQAAPDIDHTNPRVQEELTKWMVWLKHDIGFDGWRFDFVKGFAPEYVKLYCERTQPVFAVGELWPDMSYDGSGLSYDQNSHRQQLVNWVDGSGGQSSAFDFTTKGILQEACGKTEMWRLRDTQNKPSGMIGYWPSKAVTFLDNHDTGSSQNHWPFPSSRVMQGYAYILTHPGVPCLFWDHFFDWGHAEKLTELIAIRKRNGINAKSPVEILAADADCYLAKIADRVMLKLGPRFDLGNLLPSPAEFQICASGDGYAVWERK